MDEAGSFFSRDRFIERVILLTLLAFLVFACVQIVSPFIGPMLWGIIITVATWHPYRKLAKLLGNRRKLAAVLMSLALLLILVVPISLLVDSLAEGIGAVAGLLRDLGVTRVFLAGLALDYCVRFTAQDAVREGFEAVVITDASRAIAPQTEAAALDSFRALGVVEIGAEGLA